MRLYRTYTLNGEKYNVYHSESKNKKYAVEVDGKTIQFGQRNYRMFPGQERGQNYCARSLGITDKDGNKTANDINSPNYWSRKLWNCKGKKSL